MWTMYDSVDPTQIPANAPAVAGYVGGRWPDFHTDQLRFPHAHLLSIAISAEEDAQCLDVETGDATPDQAPGWVRRQLERNVWRPCLYANGSTMPGLWAAIVAAGIRRKQIRLWLADPTGVPHIPGGYDACQWKWKALGRDLDESLCVDSFFAGHARPARHASAEIQIDLANRSWRVHPLPWNAAPLG